MGGSPRHPGLCTLCTSTALGPSPRWAQCPHSTAVSCSSPWKIIHPQVGLPAHQKAEPTHGGDERGRRKERAGMSTAVCGNPDTQWEMLGRLWAADSLSKAPCSHHLHYPRGFHRAQPRVLTQHTCSKALQKNKRAFFGLIQHTRHTAPCPGYMQLLHKLGVHNQKAPRLGLWSLISSPVLWNAWYKIQAYTDYSL